MKTAFGYKTQTAIRLFNQNDVKKVYLKKLDLLLRKTTFFLDLSHLMLINIQVEVFHDTKGLGGACRVALLLYSFASNVLILPPFVPRFQCPTISLFSYLSNQSIIPGWFKNLFIQASYYSP